MYKIQFKFVLSVLLVGSTIFFCKKKATPPVDIVEQNITEQSTTWKVNTHYSQQAPFYIDSRNRQITISTTQTTPVGSIKYKLFQGNKLLFAADKKATTTIVIDELVNNTQLFNGKNQFKNQDFTLHVEVTHPSGKIEKLIQQIAYRHTVKTNLPIVAIEVENGISPGSDKKKHKANFYFFDQPTQGQYSLLQAAPTLTGKINVRGAVSSGFPKKGYTLSLDNTSSIIGFKEHKKWILLSDWVDASHIVNASAYAMYRDLGHYAVQMRPVVVYFNGMYQGVYSFGEKIEGDRLPLAAQHGFLVKVDNSTSPDIYGKLANYFYEYTASTAIAVQEKINKYETALVNQKDWRVQIDEQAQIDFMILHDVWANGDGYSMKKNYFLFLNKNDQLEPVIWDFDWAFGPRFFVNNGNNPWPVIYNNNKTVYQYDKERSNLAWHYDQDPTFFNQLKTRYKTLRLGILSDAHVQRVIDQIAQPLEAGNHYTTDQLIARHLFNNSLNDRFTAQEIKQKIQTRLNFLDSRWQ